MAVCGGLDFVSRSLHRRHILNPRQKRTCVSICAITRGIFMSKTGHITHLSLTPTQIIAAIMVITGGLLRLAAYKTLGPYFTFQVGIQPDQKLITHGVYAWVRHPSYTVHSWRRLDSCYGTWRRGRGFVNRGCWIRGWGACWDMGLRGCGWR